MIEFQQGMWVALRGDFQRPTLLRRLRRLVLRLLGQDLVTSRFARVERVTPTTITLDDGSHDYAAERLLHPLIGKSSRRQVKAESPHSAQ